MNAYGDDRIALLTSLPRAWDDRGARKRFWANALKASRLSLLSVVVLGLLIFVLSDGIGGFFTDGMNVLHAMRQLLIPIWIVILIGSTVDRIPKLVHAHRILNSEPWRLVELECGTAVAAGMRFGFILANENDVLISDLTFMDAQSQPTHPEGNYSLLVAGDVTDTLLIRSADAFGYYNALNVTTRPVRSFHLLTRLRRMAALLAPRAVDYLDDTDSGRKVYVDRWLLPSGWFIAAAIASVLWVGLAAFGPGVMHAYFGGDSIRGAMVVEKTYVIGAGRGAVRYYDGEFRSEDATVSEYLVGMSFEPAFARGSKITLIKSGEEYYPGFVNLSVLVIVGLIAAGSLTIAVLVLVWSGLRDQRQLGALKFAQDSGKVIERPYDSGNYPSQ